MKDRIKTIQKTIGVTADGIIGPNTLSALEKALGIETAATPSTTWPTQAQVRSGNSIFGKPGNENALISITPPYTLYYEGTPVRTIRVHKLIAEPVQQALREVLQHYGAEEIHRLGLDLYSGSYNYRSTSSGTALSMHAWGIALDFDAEHNTYSMHTPAARYSGTAYTKWWEIWESKGATSLGRERDIDWMHLQFATL